jgi:hypothetical protein
MTIIFIKGKYFIERIIRRKQNKISIKAFTLFNNKVNLAYR